MLWNDGGLYGNVCAGILTVVYCQMIVAVCDAFVRLNLIPSDVSRKMVHMGAGSLILFWNLFDETHWSWKLNILATTFYAIQVFVKGAILCNPDDPDVRAMTRHGNPTELLYGPLIFAMVMNANGIFLFRDPISIYCIAALGYGDGLAPLIGRRWPIRRYRCPGGIKSVGGSMAVFFGSIVGYVVFSTHLGIPERDDFVKILAMAVGATLSEALSPSAIDNIVVPVSVYCVMRLIE